MTDARQRATALLDVLHHREPGDRTAESVDAARRYRACKASGLYPIDALEWAWADKVADRKNPQPGELDRRKTQIVDGVERDTAFGAMARWLHSVDVLPTGTCVLSGQTGSGKNVAAMYAAIHRGGAYYLGSAISDIALGDSPLLLDLARVPLLVIDELGRETLIGPTLSRIDTMLTARHDNRRATLITTNLTQPEFKKRYGDHTMDRVLSSGGYAEIASSSRRMKGVAPRLTSITRHCRIADLVDAVYTLTCAGRTNVPDSVIDKLAAEFKITEAQIGEAIEHRKRVMVVPAEISLGPIGRALRVAIGELPPAEDRKHDPRN
jgi:hypothetical protein